MASGRCGIVASRLKEAAGRPAVVIGIENGEGKGSGRSVSGIDLGAAIQNLAAQGVLIKGDIKWLQALAWPKAARNGYGKAGSPNKTAGLDEKSRTSLRIDTVLMPSAATVELVEDIGKAGPFGAGSPAPCFAFADVMITLQNKLVKII